MSTGSGRFLLILHDAKDGTEAGRAKLRTQLSAMLHLSTDALNSIFSSLPVIVKYDLSAEQADRFVQFFESVGAEVEALEGHPGRSLPAPGQPELAILESPEVKFALAMLLDGPPDRSRNTADSVETLTLNEDANVEDLERLLDDALLETGDATLDVSASDDQPLGVSLEELTRMLEMEDALPPSQPPAPAADMTLAFDEEPTAKKPDVRSILLDEPVEKAAELQRATPPSPAPEPTPPLSSNIPPLTQKAPMQAAPIQSANAAAPEDETTNLPQLRGAPEPQPQSSPHLPQPFAFGPPPPVDSAEEDEEEEEEEDEPTQWYAIPKNRQLFMGTAIVAVFMLLLGVNKYLLSSNEETVTLKLTPEALNALLKEQRSILDRGGDTAEIPKNRFSWTGEATEGITSSRITIIEQNGIPVSVDLSIRQVQAPKRTLKEVADGVTPHVWLRLCVAQNLQMSAGDEPGTVLFHGQAKAYFSDEERNARGVVSVTGKLWREYDRYVGSWNLALNSDGSPELPEYILERENRDYIVKISGTFIAKDRTKILRERLASTRGRPKAHPESEGEVVDGEAASETER